MSQFEANMVLKLTPEQSRRANSLARQVGRGWATEVVLGDQDKVIEHEGWHYLTKGGRRIYHPGAYSKSGWSNMVYMPSTCKVMLKA